MSLNFENLNDFLNRHKFSKGSFVEFLKIEKFVTIIDENSLHSNTEKIFIIDNQNIFIDSNFFYRFITNNDTFSSIVLLENHEQPIYEIEDKITRKKRIKEASKKRLLFLDFEFVLNQYYEVAYSVFENGIEINKGYFFEEKALNDKFILNNNRFSKLNKIQNKTDQLKVDKKMSNQFDIMNRKRINYILKDIIESIDYMVVHHCNSELSILKENNIFFPKSKCICTDELFRNEIDVEKKNGSRKEHLSLSDLTTYFDIKMDVSKQHYAYYDVEMLKEVFFKIVDYYDNPKN